LPSKEALLVNVLPLVLIVLCGKITRHKQNSKLNSYGCTTTGGDFSSQQK
jgi:hypothetical protein